MASKWWQQIPKLSVKIWDHVEPFVKISAYSFHIFLVSILSKQNENLVGSPQTGRTDFIKYLSAHCGRFVVTIPSLESVSLEVVTRVFSGVASSASWAIFSNIDRLNKNVLSHITDCLYHLSLSYSMNTGKVVINQVQIPFNTASRVFFTTTAGDKSNIPQNLKSGSMLKNLAISTPQKRLMIEVQLT